MAAIRTFSSTVPNNFRLPEWEVNLFYPRGSLVRVDNTLYDSDGNAFTYADIFVAAKNAEIEIPSPELDTSGTWNLIYSGAEHINYDSDIRVLYEADSDIRVRIDSDFHYFRNRDSEHDSDIHDLRAKDSEIDSDIHALRAKDSEQDSDIKYLYDWTIKLRGFVDVAEVAPYDHEPKWGDAYILHKDGAATEDWGNLEGRHLLNGQMIVYNDSEWRLVGEPQNDSEHVGSVESLWDHYSQESRQENMHRVRRGDLSRSIFIEYDSDHSALLYHDDGLDGPCFMDGQEGELNKRDIKFTTSLHGPETQVSIEYIPVDEAVPTLSISAEGVALCTGTQALGLLTDFTILDSEDQRAAIHVELVPVRNPIRGDLIRMTHTPSGTVSTMEFDGGTSWRKWTKLDEFLGLLDSEIHDRKSGDSEIFNDHPIIRVGNDFSWEGRENTTNVILDQNMTTGAWTVSDDIDAWVWDSFNGRLILVWKGRVVHDSILSVEPATTHTTIDGTNTTSIFTKKAQVANTVSWYQDGAPVGRANSISNVDVQMISPKRYLTKLEDSEFNIEQYFKENNDNIAKLTYRFQNEDSDLLELIRNIRPDSDHIVNVSSAYNFSTQANTKQNKLYFSQESNLLFFDFDSDQRFVVRPNSDITVPSLIEVTQTGKDLLLLFNGVMTNKAGTLTYQSSQEVGWEIIVGGATGLFDGNTIQNFQLTDSEDQRVRITLDSESFDGDTLIFFDSESTQKTIFERTRDYREEGRYKWRQVDPVSAVDSDIIVLYDQDSDINAVLKRPYFNLVDSERVFSAISDYGTPSMVVDNGVVKGTNFTFFENGNVILSATPGSELYTIYNDNDSEINIYRTTDGTKRLVAVGELRDTIEVFVGVYQDYFDIKYIGDHADVTHWLYQRSLRHDSEITANYNNHESGRVKFFSIEQFDPVVTLPNAVTANFNAAGTTVTVNGMNPVWFHCDANDRIAVIDSDNVTIYNTAGYVTDVPAFSDHDTIYRRGELLEEITVSINGTVVETSNAYSFSKEVISSVRKNDRQRLAVFHKDSDLNTRQVDSDNISSFQVIADYINEFDSDFTKEEHDRKAADSDVFWYFYQDIETITLVAGQATYNIVSERINEKTVWEFDTTIISNGFKVQGIPYDHYIARHNGTNWIIEVDGVDTGTSITAQFTSTTNSSGGINIPFDGDNTITLTVYNGEPSVEVALQLSNELTARGIPNTYSAGASSVTWSGLGFAEPEDAVLRGINVNYSSTANPTDDWFYNDGDTITVELPHNHSTPLTF